MSRNASLGGKITKKSKKPIIIQDSDSGGNLGGTEQKGDSKEVSREGSLIFPDMGRGYTGVSFRIIH